MALPPRPTNRPASASGINRPVRPSGIRSAVPAPTAPPPAAGARTSGLRPRVPGPTGSGIRAAASAPSGEQNAPAAAPGARSTKTTLRRKPAPRRANSTGAEDGMYRLMRIGIGIVIVVVIAFARGATSSVGPNQRYFNQAADLSEEVERHKITSREAMKRRLDALPIAGVTDPKLRELHQILLSLATSPESANDATYARFDKLVDELNATYGRR